MNISSRRLAHIITFLGEKMEYDNTGKGLALHSGWDVLLLYLLAVIIIAYFIT